MTDLSSLPLSRLVAVDDIASSGTRIVVTPTDAERVALARLATLVSIDALSASLVLMPEGAHGVHVTGTLEATIVQTCVVSLESFESQVNEPVDIHFLAPLALEAYRVKQAALATDDDEVTPDEPDPIEEGSIDLGALIAEHLVLGLDPYPRKPGATLAIATDPADAKTSPFAVLRALEGGRS